MMLERMICNSICKWSRSGASRCKESERTATMEVFRLVQTFVLQFAFIQVTFLGALNYIDAASIIFTRGNTPRAARRFYASFKIHM